MQSTAKPTVLDLGQVPYADAYEIQCAHHTEVLKGRGTDDHELGRILIVEHPAVITVTRRPDAASHVLASKELLASRGVDLHHTDRGGDVTYHGPGQLVCYPIMDLNAIKLRLHDYIRVLEESIIRTLGDYGIVGFREEGATGVWVQHEDMNEPAKIAAIGVRVRKWITMHGLSLNIDPDMDHFGLIVPCGLSGRPVVSMRQLLGRDRCPSFSDVCSLIHRFGMDSIGTHR